jgi:hypothetical protein
MHVEYEASALFIFETVRDLESISDCRVWTPILRIFDSELICLTRKVSRELKEKHVALCLVFCNQLPV